MAPQLTRRRIVGGLLAVGTVTALAGIAAAAGPQPAADDDRCARIRDEVVTQRLVVDAAEEYAASTGRDDPNAAAYRANQRFVLDQAAAKCPVPSPTPSSVTATTPTAAPTTPGASPTGSAAPVPTPTTSPPPGPSATPTGPGPSGPVAGCPAFPAFPDASCTGWRHTGVTLRACPPTITRAGTYDSCDFTQGVYVTVANVTITRSRVLGRVGGSNAYDANRNLVLVDVEIDGRNADQNGQSAVGDLGYTLVRGDVHNTGRGAAASDNVTIRDSWFHDFFAVPLAHMTGVGSNGGARMVFDHNNVECTKTGASDGGCSAALALYGDFSPITDVLVTHNLLNTRDGVYCTHGGSEPSKKYPNATYVRYVDNVFGQRYNPRCGAGGPVASWRFNAGNVWTGNVYQTTGQEVRP